MTWLNYDQIFTSFSAQKGYISLVFNPHLPSGLFHPYQLEEPISIFMGADVLFSFSSYFL